MSITKELPRHDCIQGLRLKRRVGDKIIIQSKNGDKMTIQVVAFWSGPQVTLAFDGDDFRILRGELAQNGDE